MPADEQITAQEHNGSTAAPLQSSKQARSRRSDDGPEILPCMEHFVTLVRKAKRPGLVLLLVERASATSLPEVAALTEVAKGSFSWEPGTGALGVFCEDREVRRELATIFRDVVLACDGEINDMPMREFDLFGFSTPAMLKRIEQERVAGIEKISILQIKVARPFEQQTTDAANGRDLIQHLSSTMLIGKDRRDTRQIYQVAYDDYGVDDLTGYTLVQVKLVFRMAKQPHRKAHNVAVQITSPNGLNDKSKTEDDRKRVLEQLTRIGVLREF